MGYLRQYDYKSRIQLTELNALTTNDANILTINEGAAQRLLSSKLQQKYDITNYFQLTLIWDPTVAYKANQLVELNYAAWSAKAYTINSLVTYTDGNAYMANAATLSGDIPGTSGKWTKIGIAFALYYIPFPYPPFNINEGGYGVGDKTWFKDSVYTAAVPTTVEDHDSQIQFDNTFNVPYGNTFPDDPVNGSRVWGIGVPYSVAAGTLPNAAPWVQGDNRDQDITRIYVDLVLYYVAPRIAPQNIPEIIVMRFEQAIKQLEKYAKGIDTCTLPRLQPYQGTAIRVGSNVKKKNQW